MLRHLADPDSDPPLVRAVLGMLAGMRLALTLPALRGALAGLAPDVYAPVVRRAQEAAETWTGLHPNQHVDALLASLYFTACADCVVLAAACAGPDPDAADAAARRLARELVELDRDVSAFRAAVRRLPAHGLLN